MPAKTPLSRHVLTFSQGLVSTLVDLTLITAYTLAEFTSTPRSQWHSVDLRVQTHLDKFNSSSLKRALFHLYKQGLATPPPSETHLPLLTKTGRHYLANLIPQYQLKRPWDGRIYLIAYDLPQTRNKDRAYLRRLLKSLGCALLQKSVWLTPYNPKSLLLQHLDSRQLNRLIAVSELNTQVGIGAINLKQLIHQVYPVTKLNHQYQFFLKQFSTPPINKTAFAFAYWKILRQDPQLPFQLLPPDWLGHRAYELFHRHTHLS